MLALSCVLDCYKKNLVHSEFEAFFQRRYKKCINHLTHPLNSANISIFSPEISKFCYIKKCTYRLDFDT